MTRICCAFLVVLLVSCTASISEKSALFEMKGPIVTQDDFIEPTLCEVCWKDILMRCDTVCVLSRKRTQGEYRVVPREGPIFWCDILKPICDCDERVKR